MNLQREFGFADGKSMDFASRGNRDLKRRLTAAGKREVAWIFRDQLLPENALLRIPSADVGRIFEPGHGTKRVDMLFRLAQRRLISRVVVATVAQQEDYMNRIRGNGGSRSSLRPEGIVIFGQYDSHRLVAETLGLPVPGPGESVSVRLASIRGRRARATSPSVSLGGHRRVVAQEDDPLETAPLLPGIGALRPSLRYDAKFQNHLRAVIRVRGEARC